MCAGVEGHELSRGYGLVDQHGHIEEVSEGRHGARLAFRKHADQLRFRC